MEKRKIASFVLGTIFLILPSSLKAEATEILVKPDLVINEIMWQGSDGSTADEWVEIYNTTKKRFDLAGYSLCGVSEGDPLSCKWEIIFPDSQIAGESYFLISNYEPGEKSVLNIEADIIDKGLSLSNTQFQIALRDKSGSTIDVAGDGKKPFFPESSKVFFSMQRNSDFADGREKSSWSVSKEVQNITEPAIAMGMKATPTSSGRPVVKFALSDMSYRLGEEKLIKVSYSAQDDDNDLMQINVRGKSGAKTFIKSLSLSETSFVLPASQACWTIDFIFVDKKGLDRIFQENMVCYKPNKKIYFSEVLSSPKDHDWNKDGKADSKDEWFELYNSSDEKSDLKGWRIKDKSGKSFTLPTMEIKPDSYLAIYPAGNGLSINNSGESLYLYDPGGILVDSLNIPGLNSNLSYARFEEGWIKTEEPTPSLANKRTVNEPLDTSQQKSFPVETIPVEVDTAEFDFKSVEAEVEVVTEKITYNTSLSFTNKNYELSVPKVDGSLVLGAYSERRINAFNSKVFLIYLLTFCIIIITSIIYVFYRRE